MPFSSTAKNPQDPRQYGSDMNRDNDNNGRNMRIEKYLCRTQLSRNEDRMCQLTYKGKEAEGCLIPKESNVRCKILKFSEEKKTSKCVILN